MAVEPTPSLDHQPLTLVRVREKKSYLSHGHLGTTKPGARACAWECYHLGRWRGLSSTLEWAPQLQMSEGRYRGQRGSD